MSYVRSDQCGKDIAALHKFFDEDGKQEEVDDGDVSAIKFAFMSLICYPITNTLITRKMLIGDKIIQIVKKTYIEDFVFLVKNRGLISGYLGLGTGYYGALAVALFVHLGNNVSSIDKEK